MSPDFFRISGEAITAPGSTAPTKPQQHLLSGDTITSLGVRVSVVSKWGTVRYPSLRVGFE
jgi:hypothetical protein